MYDNGTKAVCQYKYIVGHTKCHVGPLTAGVIHSIPLHSTPLGCAVETDRRTKKCQTNVLR